MLRALMEYAHSCPHHFFGFSHSSPWTPQVLKNAGLAFHAITLNYLFATYLKSYRLVGTRVYGSCINLAVMPRQEKLDNLAHT